MTPEQLPCPFCGGTNLFKSQRYDDGAIFRVGCLVCNVAVEHRDKNTAVDKWNYRAQRAAPVSAVIAVGMRDGKYADSTPKLHVGDSSFEDWYQAHEKACTGDKQLAHDAYAAGMGDPLVTYAQPAESRPVQPARYGPALLANLDAVDAELDATAAEDARELPAIADVVRTEAYRYEFVHAPTIHIPAAAAPEGMERDGGSLEQSE